MKSPDGGQAFVGAGRIDAHLAVGGADREQAGGAAGDVGEVDRLRVGPEIGALDRLQVDEIVDQSEQMAAGGGDVGGIAGIIAAQGPLGLGAQPLGIVDDVGESGARSACSSRSPKAEPSRGRKPGAGSLAGCAASGWGRRRARRRGSRRSGPCRRSAARPESA